MSKTRIAVIAAILALVAAIIGIGIATSAQATVCVPRDAYVEHVEHDAVTHQEKVIDAPASPAVWANFSPTNTHAPFVGPPSYPSDSRGKWNVHNQIPGGHVGPDGVYAKGNPAKGGNWFYRKAAVAEQSHMITVVDHEAYTENIPHPAVVCQPPGDDDEPQVVQPITPPVLDPCGLDNATWDLTGGSPSNNFTQDLTNDGVLSLIAVDGYEFPNGDTTLVLGKAPDSGQLCPPSDEPPSDNPPVDEPPVNNPPTTVGTPPAQTPPVKHNAPHSSPAPVTTPASSVPTEIDAGL